MKETSFPSMRDLYKETMKRIDERAREDAGDAENDARGNGLERGGMGDGVNAGHAHVLLGDPPSTLPPIPWRQPLVHEASHRLLPLRQHPLP